MLLQVTGRQVDIGGDSTVELRGRRFLSGVSCGVLLQIAPVVECSDTFFTGGSFYSCVGPLVCRQGIFPGEPLVTFRARIWLLTCVGQASNLQATFRYP